MTVANAKPDLLLTGPLGTTMVNAASSAWWDVSTVEAKISEAVAYAVKVGANICYVPACFLPYTASQVTFNNTVQMMREGGIVDGSLFDVQAYGAAGNDTQDDTVAFQAAADAAKANTATLYIAGDRGGANQATYRLNGTINITGNNRRVVQDFGGIIKCYNATGPALWFRGAVAGNVTQQFVHVWGLSVQAAVSGYKQPLVQLGDAAGFSWFSVENSKLDNNPGSFSRDGFWLHTAFNGSIKDSFVTGFGGGRAFVWRNDPAINGGNVNFINCVHDNPIAPMFCVQEYYGVANNLVNSIHFDNCKAGGNIGPINKFFAGTVAGNQSINSATITLTGGQGTNYVAGDWITVIHGATFWTDKVTSVSTDTLTLTDPAGTPFALSTNDPVIVGIWHSILGPNVKNVRFDVPHFERTNGVLGTANTRAVTINEALFGASVFRGAYLATDCQMWTMTKPRGASVSGTVVFHQANDANNSRNVLEHAVQADFSGTAPTMIQIDGGSYVGWNARLGLQETLLGVWHQDTTVAASQTNVQLTGPMGAVRTLRMSTYGSVTRIVVAASSARAAGTLTATVFKTGGASTLTAVLDGTNTTYKITENVNPGAVLAFVPGDTLDVRVTTDSGWLPTANNIDVAVYGTM